MKHWHWVSLAFLAVVLAVVAMAVPRLSGGTEQAGAQGGITVSLDMDISDGPCTDIDNSASHATGPATYDVAICVTGLVEGYPIGSFTFDVTYDDTLNTAPTVAVGNRSTNGLDDNPDANAGTTTWGSSLGTHFDCSSGGAAYPSGDRNAATGPGNGDAFMFCESTSSPWTLGDNETSGVIAVITFTANYGGTDTLVIADSSYLAYTTGSVMGECDPDAGAPMTCNGGSDSKSGTPWSSPTPTDTPTITPTPWCGGPGQPECPTATPTRRPWTRTPTPAPTTDTPTPEGEGGEAGEGEQPPPPPPPPPTGEQMPLVVPPGTGSGPAEGMPWLTGLLWLMAGAGAVSVALGGLLGYGRARGRPR